VFALGVGGSAFAQENTTEYHDVSGRRIWPPVGPVWAEGPLPDPVHGCAEPNCGQSPNDPSGGGATTQKQKDAQNKTNTEKAKAAAETILKAAKAAQEVLKTLKAWFSGFVEIHFDDTETSIDADGKKTVKGPCADIRFGVGGSEKPPLPCTTIKGEPEKVQRSNGSLEYQLRLTFEVYEECFYEKKCAPKYYSIIAGSDQELSKLLNQMTGTAEF
jgi:hypothetical protein